MTLEKAKIKKNQNEYKSDLNWIKREEIKRKSKKTHYVILKCFTKQEPMILIFLMIICEAKHASIHGKS